MVEAAEAAAEVAAALALVAARTVDRAAAEEDLDHLEGQVQAATEAEPPAGALVRRLSTAAADTTLEVLHGPTQPVEGLLWG